MSGAYRTTALVRLVAAGLGLGAACLILLLSMLGYETLKGHLDPLSVDRDANLTRAEFDDIVARLRRLAAGLAVLSASLLVLGSTLDQTLDAVGRAWWRGLRSAPHALREWVSRDACAAAVLALVVLVAAGVRLAFLDVPLRYDEATTYNNFVSKPLYVALANYATPNNHLLHTLLAKLSVTVFGAEPWAIRLPALVAGLAIVPATYALARTFYGRSAALLAASFVAASSTHVEYSTNARGYTLVALATVVVFIAAAQALRHDSVAAWAVVVAAGTLGLYAVPVMVYPLGGALLWIVASGLARPQRSSPVLKRTSVAALAIGCLTLLLYAPVYAASGISSVTSNEFVEPQAWSTLVDRLPTHAVDTVGTWARDLPAVAWVALTLGLLGGMLITPRISRFAVPILVPVIAWSALVVVLQRVVPYTRVWLFLVPLVAATAAGFYGSLVDKRKSGSPLAPALALVVAITGSLAVLSADSVRQSRETGALLDAPQIATFLAARVEPDDRILATGSDTILEYYLAREGVDANTLLYTDQARTRTFLIVNTLGGQTVDDLLRQLTGTPRAQPALLRAFPSGRVYLVEGAQ